MPTFPYNVTVPEVQLSPSAALRLAFPCLPSPRLVQKEDRQEDAYPGLVKYFFYLSSGDFTFPLSLIFIFNDANEVVESDGGGRGVSPCSW